MSSPAGLARPRLPERDEKDLAREKNHSTAKNKNKHRNNK